MIDKAHITLSDNPDFKFEATCRDNKNGTYKTICFGSVKSKRKPQSKYKSKNYIHTSSFWAYWLLFSSDSIREGMDKLRKKYKVKVTAARPVYKEKLEDESRTQLYCGNNRLYHGIVNGTHRIGTRHRCLRRGVGIGLNLPVDNTPDTGYEPIDPRRVYCGNQNLLPDQYDLFGTLPQCLQKGVGVGRRMARER